MRGWVIAVALMLCFACKGCEDVVVPTVQAQPVAVSTTTTCSPHPRCVVLISDLHFGVGKDGSGKWDPTEDFRWSKELVSFLNEITQLGSNKVDLVIAGDLLELWQPPDDRKCASNDPNYGCTVAEMEAIASVVVTAHRSDLEALGAFANTGENRLIVIPGNHDAALLLSGVWQQVENALKVSKKGKVILVKSGVWVSQDGTIVAEHGHQIGKEVNKWEKWPTITGVRPSDRKEYVMRPWGEWFVQRHFNEREREYPIIDNLSPETAGIRYYMAAHTIVGNIKDWASFLKFNLVETSFAQKGAALGGDSKGGLEPKWDLTEARKKGYRLFADALSSNDPIRKALLDINNMNWDGLRQSLSELAMDEKAFPVEELRHICSQLDIRQQEAEAERKHLPADEKGQDAGMTSCTEATAGAAIQGLIRPRDSIMQPHLDSHVVTNPNMQVFVYGHTHVLEFDWTLKLFTGTAVSIFNTGAFQRLIDDEMFLAEAKRKGKQPAEALRVIQLEELPACYAAVFVEYVDAKPTGKIKNWFVDGNGKGSFVEPCDSRCAKVSKRCRER